MNLEQWLFTTGVNAKTVHISIYDELYPLKDPTEVTIEKSDRDAFIVPTADTTDKALLIKLIKETMDPQIQDINDRIPDSEDILDFLRKSGELFCDKDAVKAYVESLLDNANVTIDV
tara:strand:+ start:61 stop:411 length:351 start_codon:yes stop_codon:yes gene_type:complete